MNVPMSVEYDNLVKSLQQNDELSEAFTDEEGYGRHLDLNELYQKYINLKGVEVKKGDFSLLCFKEEFA